MEPVHKRVYVYKPGEPVQELMDPEEVSAEPVLPGFVLKPREIWCSGDRGTGIG